MFLVWLKFAVCALIVLVSGTRLSKYGDAIAEKTGLSRAWIGFILLAAITSMPELVSGVSAVAIVGVPDLAVGLVLGSNIFNYLILALLDVLHPHVPFLAAVSRRHMLSGSLYLPIVALAGAGILVSNQVADLRIGWVGVFSLVLLAAYLSSLRAVARSEQASEAGIVEKSEPKYLDVSSGRTYLSFSVSAVLIIGAGIWLASIGDEIAEVTGWGASFVGTLLLPIINSLPEATVSIAAMRLAANDMALANIIGSNMFNTAVIIPVADLFYVRGSLLSAASPIQTFTTLIAILMTGVLLAGIRFRSKRKVFRVASWEPLLIVALYVAGAYLLFSR